MHGNVDYTKSCFNPNTTYQPTSASYFTYSDVDGGVEITDYTGSSKNIKIPCFIDGKKVVSIGYLAFGFDYLTTVTIPSSVISIG